MSQDPTAYPVPNYVTIDPDAMSEEQLDRLAVELAKALAEFEHQKYHTSST